MTQDKVKQIKVWYKENEDILDKMVIKLKSTIEEILVAEKVPYSSVTSRKKNLQSLCNKAEKPKYVNPVEEIQDIVGIRIVAYVESDVEKICKIIESSFDIDKENSEDKRTSLGIDKVGYRSVHYVVKIDENRSKLQEYKLFKDLCFEIQVRTLLQHTWAEIEHDRNYKFSGTLPDEIKRKFSLIAGTLELLDKQFDSIANEMDEYTKDISEKTKLGEIEGVNIDSTSLSQYLITAFSEEIGSKIDPTFGFSGNDEMIIKELKCFGIKNLKELDKLVIKFKNKDLYENDEDTFTGILRTYMMVEDSNKYFDKCWNHNWDGINRELVNKMCKYNENIKNDLKTYKVDVITN
ncbi:GTP pyrophosphokinase [Paraclostridium tenue]